MNRAVALKRLWWKELRQLFPLLVLLLAVGTFLLLMTALLPGQVAWRKLLALLGMPALFAAGSGALLVGQEKELRTLDWLRSLPLAASDLVRTKFLVAVLGLTAVWCVSLLLGWVTGAWTSIESGRSGAYLWPLQSYFLLIIGFATAWKLRSPMIALLAVAPVACLPFFFASLHQYFIEANSQRGLLSADPQPWMVATYVLLISGAMLWYGHRSAMQYLAAQAAPRLMSETSVERQRASALNFARSSPLQALLWQFVVQNRAALLGLTLLHVVGVWLLTQSTGFTLNLEVPLGSLAIVLAVSWLGTLVFQGDGQQRRIVFLADRGLSPSLVWLTRQAIPLALIAVGTPASVLAYAYLHPASSNNFWHELIIILVGLFGVYTMTQWLGQVVSSPILAACLAPFVGGGAIAYFTYAKAELGALSWTIGLALLLPLIATYTHARAWMDRRTGWRNWMGPAGWLLLTLVLPLSYFIFYTISYPTLTAQAKRQLLSIVAQSPSVVQHPYELLSLQVQPNSGTLAERREACLAFYRRQLAEHAGPITTSSIPRTLIADAMLTRLRDPGASQIAATRRYRESIALLIQLHDRLRLSDRLWDQDQADVIEMWLVEEMKDSQASQRFGQELAGQLRRIFGNPTMRQQARRRSIALSWQRASDQHLGGYPIILQNDATVTTKDVWEASRKAGLISELLLRSLDASGERLARLRAEVAEAMGQGNWFDDRVYAEDGQELLYFEMVWLSLPGQIWNGAWEQQGRRLAEDLDAQWGHENEREQP